MDPSSPLRFPPPEFEGGYHLPDTATPGGREVWLQYLDIGVLFLALAVATWLIYKKRSRKGVVALSLFSLLYFGFWRKGCVCSIGSVQNVALGLFDSTYALPIGVLAFFIFPLVFALFAGRVFCAAVCPHGALQDLVLIRPKKVPLWLEQGLSVLPYIYLGAGVLFAATGSGFIICQYDPFVTVFRFNGRALMVCAGVALLLLGMFVGRPYCRFLCPYGALLKLGSVFSKWRVRVTPNQCTQCRLCESACPFGAMREPESGNAESLTGERRQMSWMLLSVPLLVVIGSVLSLNFSGTAARMHPTVKLAELFVREQNAPPKTGPLAPEDFALDRARQNPKELLTEAAQIRHRFGIGSAIFGAWIGLIVGIKLVSLSLRRTRTDYEPDCGSCLACARCFEFCPNEQVRRGSLAALAEPAVSLTSH
jgi:NosR/NirI family nitrous oxide reductase transcriptional regulator